MWNRLVVIMRHPIALLATRVGKHPRMLPVLGLGNIALMENRNISELSPILIKCVSTTLESHKSLWVGSKEEIYLFLEQFKDDEHESDISFSNFISDNR